MSPSSSTSEFPTPDSERDTTFDDFDLEHNERLEVAEMFGSSRSLQGRRGSEGDADARNAGSGNSSHLSINIPAGYSRLGLKLHRVIGFFKNFFFFPSPRPSSSFFLLLSLHGPWPDHIFISLEG